ncbi:MFS transporter [Streptomyces cyanogenus]|uniref:Antiseptic resistance protein n=1 Tax=Streptomyces cyanogenus TaxID=80860 RepID=A0ABX7U491_STRCY|nr:MFS transporter [Streptomyces cyanogenus]QTE02999.1 Antiseptic resistance protein [Streptomyces cyanogenus]
MLSRLRLWSVITAVICCTFLTALDNTVVNIALPQIRAQLDLTETDLKWVGTAYPLTLAGSLLGAGWLTDTKGRRWALLTGVAVFTTSSVCCALSATGATLVLFRGLQGTGAAFVLPASLALTAQDLPPRVRTAAYGATTAAAACALAFGPVLSGVVTEHLGWEWLFLMNAPLGVCAFIVGAMAVPGPSGRRNRPGSGTAVPVPNHQIALACIGLSCFVYCLIQGPAYGFTGVPVILCGVVATASVVALCRGGLGRHPALGELLRQRPYSGGLVTQLLWGLGVSGVYFYTCQFLQSGLRLSPVQAGLAFTPVFSALLCTAPFVTAMARRWGEARVCATGLLLVALGLLLVALGSERGGLADLIPGLTAVGAGSSLAIPLTTRALASAPGHLSGFAAGLFTATRELSGVFGIVLVGAVVTFVQRLCVSRQFSGTEASLAGYQAGLCIAAALVGVGAPVAVWALRRPQVDGSPHVAQKPPPNESIL